MTLKRMLLIPLAAAVVVTFATMASGHDRRGGYEVWTVDQSNSAGKTTGGTL